MQFLTLSYGMHFGIIHTSNKLLCRTTARKAHDMKTTFHARQPYADLFLKLAREFHNESPARQTRFMKVMETNQGSVAGILCGGLDEDGLERKNRSASDWGTASPQDILKT